MTKDLKESRVLQSTNVWVFVVAAVLGFFSVILPAYLFPGKKVVFYDAPLFPLIATAIKNLSILPTTLLLMLTGCILGYLKSEIWWLLGFSTILVFPISSACEMILYPTTHNLWPLEFLVSASLSIPSLIGAFLGSKFKSKMSGR